MIDISDPSWDPKEEYANFYRIRNGQGCLLHLDSQLVARYLEDLMTEDDLEKDMWMDRTMAAVLIELWLGLGLITPDDRAGELPSFAQMDAERLRFPVPNWRYRMNPPIDQNGDLLNKTHVEEGPKWNESTPRQKK